jgi:hypothetical protein
VIRFDERHQPPGRQTIFIAQITGTVTGCTGRLGYTFQTDRRPWICRCKDPVFTVAFGTGRRIDFTPFKEFTCDAFLKILFDLTMAFTAGGRDIKVVNRRP